jgi:hypothetical protein
VERTPGPTPAMMAMGFDMLVRCEATVNRRVVGCINLKSKGLLPVCSSRTLLFSN